MKLPQAACFCYSSWVKHYVHKLLSEVLGQMHARGEVTSIPKVEVTVPEPGFGDYATNAALRLSRELGEAPPKVAERIARELTLLDREGLFESVTERGGFINLTLSRTTLFSVLSRTLAERERFGRGSSGAGQRVLVEYFQPNMAKPLHLGHLGTAVIGDAVFRILESQGFSPESDTHLGDWGTQFGLLVLAYKQWGDMRVVEKDPIAELNKLYVRINAELEAEPQLREQGKAEFVKLERGDEQNRKLWEQFKEWSWREYDVVYRDLGIRRHDHDWPESFFSDKMPAVVRELKDRGLLKESQGAQIVDLEPYGLGVALAVKSDGGTTYLLRDLATFIYRKAQGFTRQIYVVDVRQSHTLAQTKKILELLGYVSEPDEFTHVAYGYTSLPEGAMSTRKGNVVGLADVVAKVREEAAKVIAEKNPELENRERVATEVAAAAIRYANLARNVSSDLVFRWEQALAFEGNTGPYLQYAHARIHGILRKAGDFPDQPVSGADFDLGGREQAVLRHLVHFAESLERAAQELQPNVVCQYLFELAQLFNVFYQEVPVLQEPDAKVRAFRLRLCAGTAQVLKNGLAALGIEAPEQM